MSHSDTCVDENFLFLEGLCYFDSHGDLRVKDKDKSWSLSKLLHGFEGREVSYLYHQLPPGKGDPTKWGWGSCHWKPTGECPSYHHKWPHNINVHSGRGTVRKWRGQWQIDYSEIPEADGISFKHLDGHDVRFVFVAIIEPDKLKGEDALKLVDRISILKNCLEGISTVLRSERQ